MKYHYMAEGPIVNEMSNVEKLAEGPIAYEISKVEESTENKMAKMLPNVLDKFSKYGLETHLLTFFQLVSANRFPLLEYSIQLWLEIVCWHRQ